MQIIPSINVLSFEEVKSQIERAAGFLPEGVCVDQSVSADTGRLDPAHVVGGEQQQEQGD